MHNIPCDLMEAKIIITHSRRSFMEYINLCFTDTIDV